MTELTKDQANLLLGLIEEAFSDLQSYHGSDMSDRSVIEAHGVIYSLTQTLTNNGYFITLGLKKE